jgi:hypothetical protein
MNSSAACTPSLSWGREREVALMHVGKDAVPGWEYVDEFDGSGGKTH